GFEPTVPRERGHRFELSLFYVPETVRVLTQRSTLLGIGGSKSRSRQANGAYSRSLENVVASAERSDGASGNRKCESISLQRRVINAKQRIRVVSRPLPAAIRTAAGRGAPGCAMAARLARPQG